MYVLLQIGKYAFDFEKCKFNVIGTQVLENESIYVSKPLLYKILKVIIYETMYETSYRCV